MSFPSNDRSALLADGFVLPAVLQAAHSSKEWRAAVQGLRCEACGSIHQVSAAAHGVPNENPAILDCRVGTIQAESPDRSAPFCRSLRRHLQITNAAATDAPDSSKTIAVRTKDGELPFPYSERDPYKLPISIERVQKLLVSLGEQRRASLLPELAEVAVDTSWAVISPRLPGHWRVSTDGYRPSAQQMTRLVGPQQILSLPVLALSCIALPCRQHLLPHQHTDVTTTVLVSLHWQVHSLKELHPPQVSKDTVQTATQQAAQPVVQHHAQLPGQLLLQPHSRCAVLQPLRAAATATAACRLGEALG
jgi:hypothetical protein